MPKDLKPCPFCGSDKLKLTSKHRLLGYNGMDMPVHAFTCSVRCNVCHARGGTAGGKTLDRYGGLPLPEWATTREVIEAMAVDNWNRRMEQVC